MGRIIIDIFARNSVTNKRKTIKKKEKRIIGWKYRVKSFPAMANKYSPVFVKKKKSLFRSLCHTKLWLIR